MVANESEVEPGRRTLQPDIEESHLFQVQKIRVALLVALTSAAAGAQAADLVYLKDAASQPLVVRTSVYITGGAFNGVVSNVLIGRYQIDQQTPATSFGAYCVDPFQYSSPDFQLYQRSSPLIASDLPVVQATRFADVGKLFAKAYDKSLENATKAAGFQLALWEVWHDDKNLATGNIRKSVNTDAASVTEAQALLSSMEVWSASGAYALTLYKSGTYQDYIAPTFGGSVSTAPEPGIYALLLTGLGVLALARRRET